MGSWDRKVSLGRVEMGLRLSNNEAGAGVQVNGSKFGKRWVLG